MQNIFNIESVNFSKSEEPGRVNDAPGFPFLLGNFIDFLFLVLLIGKQRHKEIKRINFLHIPSSGN